MLPHPLPLSWGSERGAQDRRLPGTHVPCPVPWLSHIDEDPGLNPEQAASSARWTGAFCFRAQSGPGASEGSGGDDSALSADLAAAKVAWFAIRRAAQGPGRSFPSAGYHLGKIKGLSGRLSSLALPLSPPPPAPAPTGLAPLCHRKAGRLLPGCTLNHRCSLSRLLVPSWKNFPQPPLSPPAGPLISSSHCMPQFVIAHLFARS